MRAKKVIAVLLAGVLSASALTGCGGIDQSAVIATVNGTEVSMGLANFYCRMQQASYEDIYRMYLGMDDVWMADPYNSGTNMQDSVKESALTELHEMYTLKEHMGDYGVEITAEDQTAITQAASKFMSDNSKEAIRELGASQELVEELLTLYTIRARVRDAVKAETDTNVSDEEANMRGYTQLVVTGTEEDADSAKAAAVQIETKLGEEGATLESVAEANGLETSKQTYATYESAEDNEDGEETEDALAAALKKLKEGETSGMIEKDGSYYFVRIDSDTDVEATESNRQTILTRRQNEHYSEVLEGWQTDDGWEIDLSLFGDIQFDTSLTSTDPNASSAENAQ